MKTSASLTTLLPALHVTCGRCSLVIGMDPKMQGLSRHLSHCPSPLAISTDPRTSRLVLGGGGKCAQRLQLRLHVLNLGLQLVEAAAAVGLVGRGRGRLVVAAQVGIEIQV